MIALVLGATLALTPATYHEQADMEVANMNAFLTAVFSRETTVETSYYDQFLSDRVDSNLSCRQIKDEFLGIDQAQAREDFKGDDLRPYTLADAYNFGYMAANYIQLKCFEHRSQK